MYLRSLRDMAVLFSTTSVNYSDKSVRVRILDRVTNVIASGPLSNLSIKRNKSSVFDKFVSDHVRNLLNCKRQYFCLNGGGGRGGQMFVEKGEALVPS